MATYTTEVRSICEHYAGLEEAGGYTTVNDVIDKAAPKVFDFDWEVFDEAYRPVLMRKILKHYYTREIGLETVSLWKLKLDTRLNEVMPYFNQLYRSALEEFNPFYEVDLYTDRRKTGDRVESETGSVDKTSSTTRDTDTETSVEDRTSGTVDKDTSTVRDSDSTAKVDGTQSDSTVRDTSTIRDTDEVSSGNKVDSSSGTRDVQDTTGNSTTHWDVYSDTPQGQLVNVENGTYLSEARKITDKVDGAATSYEGSKSDATSRTDTVSGTDESVTTTDSTKGEATSSENTVASVDETVTGREGTVSEGTRNTDSLTAVDETVSVTEGTKSKGDATAKTTEDYIEHVRGKVPGKSYAQLMLEWRKTFLNIDVEVVESLSDLFMTVW